MRRVLHAVCPCGSQSFESSDRLGTDHQNPEARHLLTTQQSTSSFQTVATPTRVPIMAAATINEGSFRHVEPRIHAGPADLDMSGTDEPGPSSPMSPTSPMSDSMRPTSPEALMSDEEDLDGLDDARKKKRFRPFKSIRKLFKKKRTSKSEDELDDGVRSKSTGELNLSDMEERMFDPKQTSTTTMSSSRSESSVFVPDQPSIRSSAETSKSTEHISKDFAKDLSAMLSKRKSPDKGGTARTSVDDVTMAIKEDTIPEKEESPQREKSFDDTDVFGKKRRDPFAARRVKSMSAAMPSPWAEKRSKMSGRVNKSTGDASFLDLDVVKTSPNGPLSHSAAKHKMAIKPKTRRATTRARISSRSQKPNKNETSHDSAFNDSSCSSNLGDSSILTESIEENNTPSLLEYKQASPSESALPVNEQTFSTSEKNVEIAKTETTEKERNTEKKPQQKWSPPTNPRFVLDSKLIANKSKEITSNTEARKPMQKVDTNKESYKVKASKEDTKLTDINRQKDKVESVKIDQNEPRRPVIIIPMKKDDLPSNNILTPSELVIRNKPVSRTEDEKQKADVKVTTTNMSDDEEEHQPRKSVRDRILLFQNSTSRNNSNNSSPVEVRKVQIEVADKNGNKETIPLRMNIEAKDAANANTSYNVKSNSNQGESSETSSKEQEKNQQNKRPVNKRSFMPKTDICIVCSKAVYMNEMSRSEGKVFHKACQKCVECTRTLQIGNVLLLGNKLYCRLHGSQEKMKLLKMRSELD